MVTASLAAVHALNPWRLGDARLKTGAYHRADPSGSSGQGDWELERAHVLDSTQRSLAPCCRFGSKP
jgi:hypothetical protein